MPFTYPLHALMARTGVQVMTAIGTASEPVLPIQTSDSENANDEPAQCTAILSAPADVVHTAVASSVARNQLLK